MVLVPYDTENPPMGEVDALGGAVTIINCVFGDVMLAPGEQMMLEALIEGHVLDGLHVDAHWHDASGRGVKADFVVGTGSDRYVAAVDHSTAAQAWGAGETELFLTLDLAVGEEPPPEFHGGPNDPASCGVLEVTHRLP